MSSIGQGTPSREQWGFAFTRTSAHRTNQPGVKLKADRMNRMLGISIAAIMLVAGSWAIRRWSKWRGEGAGPLPHERLESWENEGGAIPQ